MFLSRQFLSSRADRIKDSLPLVSNPGGHIRLNAAVQVLPKVDG
jgi:hypothetical protein